MREISKQSQADSLDKNFIELTKIMSANARLLTHGSDQL